MSDPPSLRGAGPQACGGSGSGDPPDVRFRAMRQEDVPVGLTLCRAAGWNQVAADWEELLALGGCGCTVATVDGRVVGTVTVVEYQARFGWIGMVLVDPLERGHGIGTSLMRHALTSLGHVPARLDATPAGYPVYTALGFVEERRLERLTRSRIGSDGRLDGDQTRLGSDPTGSTAFAGVRRMTRGDLGAVARLDAVAFGADRSALLAWELANLPEFAWVVECTSGIEAYCLGRRGHVFAQIGPVIAPSMVLAERLAAACVCASSFDRLGIDTWTEGADWTACLVRLGFVPQRPFVRMVRGTNIHRGCPETQFAILGPEWG